MIEQICTLIPNVNYTEVKEEMRIVIYYEDDDDIEEFLDECDDALEDYA